MNVLFDTNVVLDVLMDRDPCVDAASKLFALVDNGRIQGSICATTIYDIAAKDFGRSRAREQVHGLLGLFEVAPVDRDVLDAALDIDFPDYEDAVLHEAARAVGATAIVTRDRRDFANSARAASVMTRRPRRPPSVPRAARHPCAALDRHRRLARG